MALSPDAIEEKFQKISANSGWDLQTDDEREAAEKDAADAQEQLEKEQAKEAKAAGVEATVETAQAKGK